MDLQCLWQSDLLLHWWKVETVVAALEGAQVAAVAALEGAQAAFQAVPHFQTLGWCCKIWHKNFCWLQMQMCLKKITNFILNIISIVRIEFSPLVEIGVNKGHYWPEGTTDEGPTRINAGACAFLKLIINRDFWQYWNWSCTVYVFTWSKQNRKTILIMLA